MTDDELNDQLNDSFENCIRDLLDTGKKIEAIKLYRERTGVSLAEAKEAVETLAETGQPPERWSPDPQELAEVETKVVELLSQGDKLGAIRFVREQTGMGLKDAKRHVELIAARQPFDLPRSGCMAALLLLTAMAAVLCAVAVL